MKRINPKAKGWVVLASGMTTGLSKPASDFAMPKGAEKILFFSSKATVFPNRRSAQRAIDNRKKFDELNGLNEHNPFPSMRIVVLYEP